MSNEGIDREMSIIFADTEERDDRAKGYADWQKRDF